MLQSRMLFWKMKLFRGRAGDTEWDGEKEECVRGDIRRDVEGYEVLDISDFCPL